MRIPSVLATALVATAVAPAAARAATPFPAGSTWLLSGTATFDADPPKPTVGSYTTTTSISGDGRYVTFSSGSDGLSTEDDDASEQVYVKDRLTDAITLVSRQSGAGAAPIGGSGCYGSTISRDGAWVAFVCLTDVDGQDVNDQADVYLRHWQDPSAKTILVSHRAGQLTQTWSADSPTVSEHGEYVAFRTDNPLVQTDANGVGDIYRSHVSQATGAVDATVLVSRAANQGAAGDSGSYGPSISDDGQRIAFTSSATNLDGGFPATQDAFVAISPGSAGNVVQRVSGVNGSNAGANDHGRDAAISGDGKYVTYMSSATNLVAADTKNDSDVFLRAVGTKVTSLVSVGDGVEATSPTIDRDGTVVAFSSDSDAIDPSAKTRAYRIYVSDSGKLRLISRRTGDDGAATTDRMMFGGSAVSSDGRVVVFFGDTGGGLTDDDDPYAGGTYVRDRGSSPATTRLVSRGPGSDPIVNDGNSASLGRAGHSISADGRRVVFDARWHAASGGPAILVRDTQTGAVTVASRADGANGAISRAADSPVLSADGNRVAWATSESLDPADGDDDSDVYVRDLTTHRTYLASVGDAGVNSDEYAGNPVLSADGNRVSFESPATNLPGADPVSSYNVYVRDIADGRTVLASARNGTASARGDAGAFAADLTADGRKVVFTSSAADLGGADTDHDDDVYLRDLDAQTTTLVSAKIGGGALDGRSGRASISADGSRVAFASATTQLVPGLPASENVYVRDLQADTVILANRANGPSGVGSSLGSSDPAISADGTSVAFVTESANLGAPNPHDREMVFVRDLAANTTSWASTSVDGAAPTERSLTPSLTADGACVVFSSYGNLLTSFVSPDFEHVYLRALKPGCVPALPSPTPGPGPGTGNDTSTASPSTRPDLTPRDTVAPVLGKVLASNARFKVAKDVAAMKIPTKRGAPKLGTTFRFSLSETAAVTFSFEEKTAGRKAGKSCKPTVAKQPKARRCTAFRFAGMQRATLAAGAQTLPFTGRTDGKALRPGVYRVTVRAMDKVGLISIPSVLTVTVVRR